MTLTEVRLFDGTEVEIVAGKDWMLYNGVDDSWNVVELIDTATDGVQFERYSEENIHWRRIDILRNEFVTMCENGRAVPVERLIEYWRDNLLSGED